MLDMKDSLKHQKQGLATSDIRDIEGICFVKLRGQNIYCHFLYTQLPLNEDGKNLDKQLSYMKYKRTVRKFHDIGLEKQLSHFY